MSVPKKKRTKGSGGKRRSHDSLKKMDLSKCSKCGQPVRPHRACSNCGTYNGKQVIDVEVRTKKNS